MDHALRRICGQPGKTKHWRPRSLLHAIAKALNPLRISGECNRLRRVL